MEERRAELEDCLDTIKWSAGTIAAEGLQQLSTIEDPPRIIRAVVAAVCLLLGEAESTWSSMRSSLASPGLIDKVQKVNMVQITRAQFVELCEKLSDPDFEEEYIKTVAVAAWPLAVWCRAIGVCLSKTRFRDGSAVRPVAAAGAAGPLATRLPACPLQSGSLVVEPDIGSWTPEALERVPDLTVSTPGIGRIIWHGETDCRYLDIAAVVRMSPGEVLVYPDESLKPPPGGGLNKCATVTMYRCWPPSNGTDLLPDTAGQERYKEKIRIMTEQKNATFIDYDCVKGVWTFRVDHF